MWSTALIQPRTDLRDLRTLDQRRWEQGIHSTPTHPNCRCEAVLIDPEDEFWNETDANGQFPNTSGIWTKAIIRHTKARQLIKLKGQTASGNTTFEPSIVGYTTLTPLPCISDDPCLILVALTKLLASLLRGPCPLQLGEGIALIGDLSDHDDVSGVSLRPDGEP